MRNANELVGKAQEQFSFYRIKLASGSSTDADTCGEFCSGAGEGCGRAFHLPRHACVTQG